MALDLLNSSNLEQLALKGLTIAKLNCEFSALRSHSCLIAHLCYQRRYTIMPSMPTDRMWRHTAAWWRHNEGRADVPGRRGGGLLVARGGLAARMLMTAMTATSDDQRQYHSADHCHRRYHYSNDHQRRCHVTGCGLSASQHILVDSSPSDVCKETMYNSSSSNLVTLPNLCFVGDNASLSTSRILLAKHTFHSHCGSSL